MGKKLRIMKKLWSLILTAVLCIGLLPTTAFAAQESTDTVYLALGDSITYGTGLGTGESSFVSLFASYLGAENTVTNEGQEGWTTKNLLAALQAGEYDSEIAAADVITITIGGNDMMSAFYGFLAAAYNADKSETYKITADDVQAVLKDSSVNSTLALQLLTVLNSLTVNVLNNYLAFATSVSDFVSNINSIAAEIKAVNGDAVILIANQYNPYQWIGNTNVSALFSAGISAFNLELSSRQTSDYTIADVASAFAGSATSLTNASGTDYDFHPNAVGHKKIASVMTDTYAEVVIYTWEIPVEITVKNSGSAEAPAQTFSFEFLDMYGDVIDMEEIGATNVVNTFRTSGSGTFTGSIQFSGTWETDGWLSDGFFLQLTDGGETGWGIDGTVYMIGYNSEYFKVSDIEISVCEEDISSSVSPAGATIRTLASAGNGTIDKVSFTCSYTGWTLSFEANGGTQISDVEGAVNTVIDLSAYKPEKTGYTFNGWYSDSALKTKATSVTLSADMTVYAGWTQNAVSADTHTLTLDTNGGSAIDPITAEDGTVIDLSDYTPTKEGYTFSGWYSDQELKTKVTSVTLTDDLTVYAGWTKKEVSADPAASETDSGMNSSQSGDSSSTASQTEESTSDGTSVSSQSGDSSSTDVQTEESASDSTSVSPQTGDGSPVVQWLALLMLGGLGIAALYRKRKIN
ncbi:MAG: InlB B-repeat-containing protein [Clostridiales bacterium]|nr:InlB B-repeat-containing protein [Clostridiales bacterium]